MRMTLPFHPQANGAAERTNKTMKQVLQNIFTAKMLESQAVASPNWLRLLDCVETVINNAPIADTESGHSTRTCDTSHSSFATSLTWMRSV